MKKKYLIVLAFAAAFLLLILPVNSCFSPYTGQANVVVVPGGGKARAAIVLHKEEIAEISHTYTLSEGPGPSQEQTKTGGEPATFTIVPGRWKITIMAYKGRGLIASGEKVVDIGAGNNTVGVDMETIDEGSGTAADPWIVYSEDLLRKVGKDDVTGWGLSAHYKLLGDITLTDELWEPIAKSITVGNSGIYETALPFTGTFDGNGRTIFNLTIVDPSGNPDYAQGMFSRIGMSGVVKNLTLENVKIINESNATVAISSCDVTGGIAGLNQGRIENCFVSGSISDTGGWAGGIAGENKPEASGGGNTSGTSGVIINCVTRGSISSDNIAGGIVGENKSRIQNCYAEAGLIESEDSSAGGIAGDNRHVIQNCVALSLNINTPTQHVSNPTLPPVGRIAFVEDATSSTLDCNYSRADMKWNGAAHTWDNTTTTGINGRDVTAGQYGSSVWWENPTTWSTAEFDGEPGTTWNFVNIWEWDSAAKRPVLRK